MAATVLSGRGGPWPGVALAVVTTVTHMTSVLVIAAGLWFTQASSVAGLHVGLSRAAGFVIAAVGLWRLGRYLAGFGEHEARDGVEGRPATRSILGLGLAGGIVPCWDAVVLILVADLIGRLGFGLGLLGAFSLGMAAVLVGVGLLAGRLVDRLGRSGGARAWERRLGLLGSAALAGIGLYLLIEA